MEEIPRTPNQPEENEILWSETRVQAGRIRDALQNTAKIEDIITVLEGFEDEAPRAGGEPVLLYESSIAGIGNHLVSFEDVKDELAGLAARIPEDKNYTIESGGSEAYDDEPTEDSGTVVIDIGGIDSIVPEFIMVPLLDIIYVQ